MLRHRFQLPTLLLTLCCVMLCGTLACADEKEQATSNRLQLLKTYRSEFVPITPGQQQFPQEFDFGPSGKSQTTAVRTSMAENFEIAKFETYQGLYESVTGENPSRWKGVRNSVDSATIEGANKFCEKATQLMREAGLIDRDQVVRLPTEVEWEYCCKAGTSTIYSFGDNPRKDDDTGLKASILAEYAWHFENSPGNDPEVGVLKPNPWGLYDMHGYIWELCSDNWTESLTEVARTPHQPHRNADDSTTFVMRGGSWKDKFVVLRSSSRRQHLTVATEDTIGFRCVIAKEAR
jgi:formylglycine-generating enzyme required for sulfatase activity